MKNEIGFQVGLNSEYGNEVSPRKDFPLKSYLWFNKKGNEDLLHKMYNCLSDNKNENVRFEYDGVNGTTACPDIYFKDKQTLVQIFKEMLSGYKLSQYRIVDDRIHQVSNNEFLEIVDNIAI